MYFAMFPILLTLPTWVYLKSDFVGWSEPRGGEALALFGLIASLVLALVVDVVKMRKRKSIFLGAVALWSALGVGSLVPWLNAPPFWVASSVPVSDTDTSSNPSGFEGRVAHAGGALHGVPYTNSIDALQANLLSYEIFEIDLMRTSDGVIVCVHDWPGYWQETGTGQFHSPSYKEFRSSASRLKWTPCDLNTLNQWLTDNPGKKIVLDSKVSDVVSLYIEVGTILSENSVNVYPQIYDIKDFDEVSSMNWGGVLWSLYKRPVPVSTLLDLSRNLDIAAIVIERDDVESHARPLIRAGKIVYVHTVNDFEELEKLKNLGVEDIYTDVLREN